MYDDAEDAECLLTARRDNYVARTFSHMARARLDHAVSRSADLELLESEKWEMRYAHHLCHSTLRCDDSHSGEWCLALLLSLAAPHRGL